jgi:branched-chain amino acid transport system permease protein
MVAAYLLTAMNFPYVMAALGIGMIAAAVVGYLVGLIALRRIGIYFAMITVAKGQCFSEARLFSKNVCSPRNRHME